MFGNLYLTEKADGAHFTVDDVWMVEALAAAAGSVIEKARVYAQSERRRHWLEASAQITELLQPPVLLADALSQIAAQARRVSGANLVAVVQATDDSSVNVAAMEQAGDDDDDLQRLAVETMIASFAIQVGEAVRTGEVTMAPRTERTLLLVPLSSQLTDHGVLFVLFDDDRELEPEEVELLAAFTDQASLALDRAQAVSDRAELAVLTDRDRIARDLHDLVIQRLFATGLQLQGATRVASTQKLHDRIEKAVTDLDLTIRDIRSTIFELHHQPSSDSLHDDVSALVSEYASTLGFAPVVRTSGLADPAVPDEIRKQLSAVLREALSNVARHAQATRAAVELTAGPAEIILTVTDDGVGPGDGSRESGLGNVRARARGARGNDAGDVAEAAWNPARVAGPLSLVPTSRRASE
ncbi:MAG: histidine kinase [Nocardioidaceae bacterium]